VEKMMTQRIPKGRLAEPEEVVPAVFSQKFATKQRSVCRYLRFFFWFVSV